nr:lytic transglycosylase domain-containing protein [Poseidonocella pacifica]
MSFVATPLNPGETPELRKLVNTYADAYDVPRSLVHKVIQRESDYRAEARNGPYYGLMQILPATARGMGFAGSSGELLNPEENLRWGVKYLRGAWLLSETENEAVMHYARGYYHAARDQCMLVETELAERETLRRCN